MLGYSLKGSRCIFKAWSINIGWDGMAYYNNNSLWLACFGLQVKGLLGLSFAIIWHSTSGVSWSRTREARPEDHTARSADLYQSSCHLDLAYGDWALDVLSVSLLDQVYRPGVPRSSENRHVFTRFPYMGSPGGLLVSSWALGPPKGSICGSFWDLFRMFFRRWRY